MLKVSQKWPDRQIKKHEKIIPKSKIKCDLKKRLLQGEIKKFQN